MMVDMKLSPPSTNKTIYFHFLFPCILLLLLLLLLFLLLLLLLLLLFFRSHNVGGERNSIYKGVESDIGWREKQNIPRCRNLSLVATAF